MKICKLPSVFSTRRRTSASRSLEPGGGRRLQNFCHSSSGARSAKDDDGITKGPFVTETILPSKIEISQAVAPISSRKVVVRNLPRRTRPASSLTRCLSASIIPAPFQIRLLISGSFDGHDETNGRAVNRPRPGGALKPRAYQRQIGCAGDQQRHGQRDVHLLC